MCLLKIGTLKNEKGYYMNILNFIINNLEDIIICVIILMAVIFSLIALRYPLLKEQLVTLLTQAEKDYPLPDSGELKKSVVMLQLYQLLPNWMKTFVTYNMLSWMIEKTLVMVKNLWENNSSIQSYLKNNQIEIK